MASTLVTTPAPTPGTNVPPPTSTGAKIATGAAVVGVAGLLIALVHGAMAVSAAATVYDVGKKTTGWVKRKNAPPSDPPIPNPLTLFHRRSATGGRRVAYRVRLDQDPFVETILTRMDGRATLVRHQRPIVTFHPTTYQRAKIRAGTGEILIFIDQI